MAAAQVPARMSVAAAGAHERRRAAPRREGPLGDRKLHGVSGRGGDSWRYGLRVKRTPSRSPVRLASARREPQPLHTRAIRRLEPHQEPTLQVAGHGHAGLTSALRGRPAPSLAIPIEQAARRTALAVPGPGAAHPQQARHRELRRRQARPRRGIGHPHPPRPPQGEPRTPGERECASAKTRTPHRNEHRWGVAHERGRAQARLKTRVPLVPPKPKLFLTATSIFRSRAVLAQ